MEQDDLIGLNSQPVLRVARPATDLDHVKRMYCAGFSCQVLAEFEDHDGFDGVVLGATGGAYHLEFTKWRSQPVDPASTDEDLLVLYIPTRRDWLALCDAVAHAGFQTR